MNVIKNYLVTIECNLNNRRSTKAFLAVDESDAMRRAYRSLGDDAGAYYVLFARLA